MVPKKTLWAMDRHTFNLLVYNGIVRHCPPTKPGDLYYEQLGSKKYILNLVFFFSGIAHC